MSIILNVFFNSKADAQESKNSLPNQIMFATAIEVKTLYSQRVFLQILYKQKMMRDAAKEIC